MNRIKYPRTLHLPASKGTTSDDKIMSQVALKTLMKNELIITEKMDGENTTLTRDYHHARSVDSCHHERNDWLTNFWSGIRYNIPDDFRICGENLYALHSIKYTNLQSYFLGFSIWEGSRCLSWYDTQEWFVLLGIISVPVIDMIPGLQLEVKVKQLEHTMDFTRKEGFVVRSSGSFDYSEFQNNVAKYVRCDHVQTDKHWTASSIEQNLLMDKLTLTGE
jgi:hypothetical protein